MIQTLLLDRDHKHLAPSTPVGGVRLETCTRTELYWGDGTIDESTARHLFRVAAGLESPLLGETAIQGQLKKAYQEAAAVTKLSAPLHRLFQTAMHCGHRARTETGISHGAVSYSQVTVDLLCQRLPDLRDKVVSIIGVNELTEAILNFLTARGATNIILANRSMQRAELMAERYGADVLPLTEKRRLLDLSDVVISATSAPHTLINRHDFLPSDKKMLLFDLADPHDIDEDVHRLIGKTLFTLGDIELLARQNVEARRGEVSKCEDIIEEEIQELKRWESFRNNIRTTAI